MLAVVEAVVTGARGGPSADADLVGGNDSVSCRIRIASRNAAFSRKGALDEVMFYVVVVVVVVSLRSLRTGRGLQ